MSRHREKVLAHAEKRLAAQEKKNPEERLELYRKFLKIENHRLRLQHAAGGGGRDIAQKRAGLVDIILRHLFDAALEKPKSEKTFEGLSIVAVGGYGRGELNPFSDVDIMFLQPPVKKLAEQVHPIVESILYMLWDIGFKVGHSTRSVAAAVKQANEDMLSRTSLLEARRVAGDRALFDQFKTEFDAKCVTGSEQTYIKERVQNQADRHAKYGGTVFMQEPNIKNGCGGLRDYQNVLWITYFLHRVSSTSKLVEMKFLSESERRVLERAYDFLMRVRTELHYQNNRATDVLALPFQGKIAGRLNYPQKTIILRSEHFMRDYYTQARSIYNITERLSERMCLPSPENIKPTGIFSFFVPRKSRKVSFDGFWAADGRLHPDSTTVFRRDPYRLMRLFQHAQQRRLRLSPELQDLVRRRLRIVDRTFQYSQAARTTFNAILSRKGEVGRILRMMHDVDFLGRYIPEFGALTCLVQHEFFHRYTADEHTLVCIEKLDSVLDTENDKLRRYRDLFQHLEDPFVLYLALLLHDTGKATTSRHHAEASATLAQKVARRLQLTSEQRKSLLLLIDHHLTLSHIAQRRNLDDPTTVREFANVVKNQTNLDRLMLLTLVDGLAIGDEQVWSDWKETLVWKLYNSTTEYLKDHVEYYRQRRVEREELKSIVTKRLAPSYSGEIAAHFRYLPDSYFVTNSPQDIVSHVRLFRQFMSDRMAEPGFALAPAVKWIAHPDRGHSEVWICTWDREELLQKLAASFSVEKLNILSADIFTRGDSLVLDIFRVCTTNFRPVTNEREIERVERHMRKSLGFETYNFGPLLEKAHKLKSYHLSQELDFPTRIVVANDSQPIYTLVEIQTPDRLGLLHDLLRAFVKEGVSIAISRITTEKGAAIDSFYVQNRRGEKITGNQEIRSLQRTLQKAAVGTAAA